MVVVLSRTTEPMNIGATCRAMKTMGLRRLHLISPLNPGGRSARALAHGAEDILEQAEIHDDLLSAVADAVIVTGTTARQRKLRKRSLLTPAALAEHIVDHARAGKVAILFGTERTGLTNDEVDICRYLSTVDTAPDQPSLNLAQAVMLYSWEIRQAWWRATATAVDRPPSHVRPPEMLVHHPHRSTRLPTQVELESLYGHLAAVMNAVGYTPEEKLKFMTYLRQMHMRAGIVNWEAQIYHLLCRRILETLGQPKYPGPGARDEAQG